MAERKHSWDAVGANWERIALWQDWRQAGPLRDMVLRTSGAGSLAGSFKYFLQQYLSMSIDTDVLRDTVANRILKI